MDYNTRSSYPTMCEPICFANTEAFKRTAKLFKWFIEEDREYIRKEIPVSINLEITKNDAHEKQKSLKVYSINEKIARIR